MIDQSAGVLEAWHQLNLTLFRMALDAQVSWNRAYLRALAGPERSPTGQHPAAPAPREPTGPVIPKDLPMLIRAHWLLGLLVAGWQPRGEPVPA